MTRCFSFVAPSLSPWVGKVLPPWAGRFSVGLGPAVFRFWPVAVCWLFCGGRVSVGPAVFQACAVGRASVGLAVFRFGLAVLGIGRGRASLGQNLPALAKENHTFQVTFTKFKNYDKRFPGHELKRTAGMTSWRTPATKLLNM